MTSKNFNKIIKSIYKFAKSVIGTTSKVRKLMTYNKVINNLIYRNK